MIDLKKNKNPDENEAQYCDSDQYQEDGANYKDPAWVEQVILVGWEFYEEWSQGFEKSVMDMMKEYQIGMPLGVGQLLPPTPKGRCGLVKGLIRTFYLESHSDPNWSPYVALCSLTNPVEYRYSAEVSLPVDKMYEIINQSVDIFSHHRPFFYAFFNMIQIFSSPSGQWDYNNGICFKPQPRPAVNEFNGELPYLPEEIKVQILSNLDGLSIYQMSKVSHQWRVATHSRELQRTLKFPDPKIYYLINFTKMGLGGNCGPSY